MTSVVNKEAYGLMKIHLRDNVTPKEAERKISQFINQSIGWTEIIEIAEGKLNGV
jgi:hypothetical protein